MNRSTAAAALAAAVLLAGCASSGHAAAPTAPASTLPAATTAPASTPPPVAAHHAKSVTFIATGDVATITCTIEGDDQGCFPDSRASYPLSPDRMASYSMVATLHNQPGDTATVSIEIGGKIIGKVTASAFHQVAVITVYRNRPHGRWVAVPSFG